ncbi:MAG TPA: helix-hairpin-helix domain-containing protein [Pseudogracilibacillus sp.]|nr:helix-hairpin-helix domain-containing protein [Pseudogracilibacillus sp.]
MYHVRKYGLFAVFGLIILIGMVLVNRESHSSFEVEHEQEEDDNLYSKDDANSEKIAKAEVDEEVAVDIKGAVLDPGVYTVDASARVHDVVEMAGGFIKEADEQQINLAERVQDEMYVYVPKHGETETPQMPNDTSTGTEGDSELVRINQATSAELEQLSGIGPGKAEDILNYIEENGPLQSEEDLLEISGIGEKTLENFKDQIIIP